MDSIYGLLRLDGQRIDPDEVRTIVESAEHSFQRPPAHDGSPSGNAWYGNHLTLGFLPNRSDPGDAPSCLPLRHPDSGCVITAQARIDNRQELATALGVNGKGATPLSDGHLILLAYLSWGVDCLQHLLGDFAFAIWDESRRVLFCGRDPLGAGALTFVHTDSYFAFASKPEWLLSLPGVSPRPNALRVANFLVPAFEVPPDRRTWRESVSWLLHGECLTVGPEGRMKIRRWWEPPPLEACPYSSFDESKEHFLELFQEAVGCRLLEKGRQAAVMMSGGVDSVAIAATMARMLPFGTRVRSYSGIHDDPDNSLESRSILSVVDSLDCDATLISAPSMAGPLSIDDLIQVAWSRPHPVENSLLVPSMACLAASRAGESAMLHGVSGDIVSGVPVFYIADLIRSGHWRLAWSESRAGSRNNVYLRGRNPYGMFGRAAAGVLLPPGLKRMLRSARGIAKDNSQGGLPVGAELLSKDLLRQVASIESRRTDPVSQVGNPESKAMNLSVLGSGQSGYGLIGRRFGIKLSDPWADLRLVQFFRNLPMEHKARDGWTKFLVRTAFRQSVNPAVLWRKDKEHVGWRFTQQVMQHSMPFVDDVLQDGLRRVSDYVDVPEARKLLQEYQPGRADKYLQSVFDLVTLILWRCE